MKRASPLLSVAIVFATFQLTLLASDPPLPVITNLNVNGSQKSLRFAPYPAASNYTILSGTNAASPLAPNTNFFLAPFVISSSTNGTNYGYEWRITNSTGASGLYRVQVSPMSSNALLAAT